MDNNQYWAIATTGERLGPMTLEQLTALRPRPETPIWRQGLPDWTAAGDVEELRGLFAPPAPVRPAPPVAAMPYAQPAPRQMPYNYQSADNQQPPMPPTYLAWSIVAMLLCCVVTGIVALIYSTKVSSRYYAGDYEGARKASETTAIWLAVTVVCGLIAIPFQVVLSLL